MHGKWKLRGLPHAWAAYAKCVEALATLMAITMIVAIVLGDLEAAETNPPGSLQVKGLAERSLTSDAGAHLVRDDCAKRHIQAGACNRRVPV